MQPNALAELEFGDRTEGRARSEPMTFDVPTDGVAVVKNESYGTDAVDDHTHVVNVSEDGAPNSCTCPADEFGSGACKYRVAVAIAAPVIEAAYHREPEP